MLWEYGAAPPLVALCSGMQISSSEHHWDCWSTDLLGGQPGWRCPRAGCQHVETGEHWSSARTHRKSLSFDFSSAFFWGHKSQVSCLALVLISVQPRPVPLWFPDIPHPRHHSIEVRRACRSLIALMVCVVLECRLSWTCWNPPCRMRQGAADMGCGQDTGDSHPRPVNQ